MAQGSDIAEANSPPAGEAARWVLVIVVLALVCLFIRLMGLMALPIFGDEAIYLRWAQVIRGEGLSGPGAGHFHLWVSLADPKPPLHYWLLSVLFHWRHNPLEAARGLSVAMGVLSIPLMFLVCLECGRLPRRLNTAIAPAGSTLALLSCLLLIFCPFVAFYQRLATADALFLTESLAVVWLSLRWSRLVVDQPKGAWFCAIGLGIAIGLALLTRQGLSYTLCGMIPVAWMIHSIPLRTGPAILKSNASPPLTTPVRSKLLPTALQVALAALIAASLWTPYLTAEWSHRALEYRREVASDPHATLQRSDYIHELKRRIFYQDSFTDADSRSQIADRNFQMTFVPGYEGGKPTSGWLFFYLTPGVYLVTVAGMLYLFFRGQERLAIVLWAWLIFMLVPLLLFANVIYSRYILAAVPPLLIAGAFLIAEVVSKLFLLLRNRQGLAWAATGLLLLFLVAWPMRELSLQATKWPKQTLIARNPRFRNSPQGDDYQYLQGWTAGLGATGAINYLGGLAHAGPIILITNNGWGTPADAAWAYLSTLQNVTMYYTDHPQILEPGPEPGTVLLRRDKWLFPPYEPVRLPPGMPVLYITQSYINGSPAADFLTRHNPNLLTIETFKGLDDPEGGVSLFQLPTLLDNPTTLPSMSSR